MRGDKLIIDANHRKAATQIFSIIAPRLKQAMDKFVITVGGESGSGKSEIAAVLAGLLDQKGVNTLILQQDDYFYYPPKTNAQKRIADINHVGMSEVKLDLLDDNLKSIKDAAESIVKPLVIFEEDRIIQETLDVKEVHSIIVEGTYTTALKNVNQRVFIDRNYHDTRESRKKRGREIQDEFLEKILKIEHDIISGHKAMADIIVTRDYDVKENHE